MGDKKSTLENMEVKNANILVTGGTGFIGSHLVEQLIKLNSNVIVVDQLLHSLSYFSANKLGKKTALIYADICDFEKIFDIVTKFNIDYIFHLAAQPLVETAYYNPKMTLYTNILGTINVLESARLFPKVKGVIIASSDKAYGKLEKGKYSETDALRGDHPYEVSKSSADLISSAYSKTYNLPVVITRFGNVYGEGDLNFSRIIPGIMKSIIKNETLEIRSDGKYVRDYLYVKDVVKGYLLLLQNIEKTKGLAFNFGSENNYSVIDMIALIEKKLRKKLSFKILNTAQNEIPYQSLDYVKATKFVNWHPAHKVSSVIQRIYQWYNKIL